MKLSMEGVGPVPRARRPSALLDRLRVGSPTAAIFLLLNVVAIAGYLVVGWRAGYVGRVDALFFSSIDAQTYRPVSEWIFGGGPVPRELFYRPFLYPLLVGGPVRLLGAAGGWMLNVACWLGAPNLAAAAALRFTGWRWAAAAVFAAVAGNLSLLALTYHGITEVTVTFLLAAWAFGLTYLTRPIGPRAVLWTLLPLTLLAVVRPSYQVLMVLMLLVLAVAVARGSRRLPAVAAMAVCLVPVAVQLALMLRFDHYFGLSTIGEDTIRSYYLSRVSLAVHEVDEIQAARILFSHRGAVDIARFLAAHPVPALTIFASTVAENLWVGSNFVDRATNAGLAHAIDLTNRAYLLVHLAMLPVVAAAVWRVRSPGPILLYVGTVIVFLTAGLTFWQGDRLTVIALPLWTVAYAWAIAVVVRSRRRGRPLDPR